MAAGFSVKDALNKNSKAGIDESPRARFRTKDISIFKMYRNDMNFYSVADIEELAGDILLSGLKQNLELYMHRAKKANTESSQVKDGGRLSSTSYQRDIKILNLQPVN